MCFRYLAASQQWLFLVSMMQQASFVTRLLYSTAIIQSFSHQQDSVCLLCRLQCSCSGHCDRLWLSIYTWCLDPHRDPMRTVLPWQSQEMCCPKCSQLSATAGGSTSCYVNSLPVLPVKMRYAVIFTMGVGLCVYSVSPWHVGRAKVSPFICSNTSVQSEISWTLMARVPWDLFWTV